MRRIVLVSNEPWCGATWRAARLRQYLSWLSEVGGGTLVAPVGPGGPCLVPGVKHVNPVNVADHAGLSVDEHNSDYLKRVVRSGPQSIIHALSIESGLGGLMARRQRHRVIIEPGVRPVHVLKDKLAGSLATHAERGDSRHRAEGSRAQLAALAELEDRALKRADAVIAGSTVEAAHLAQLGLAPNQLIIAPFGVTKASRVQSADLPRLAVYVGQHGGVGLDFFYGVAQRLKGSWRALVIYDPADARIVRTARIPSAVHDKLDWCELTDGVDYRLGGCQIVLCARPTGRTLLSGALNPDEVYWALTRAIPLVAPDFDVIRGCAGPAPVYYAPDDADACARLLDALLSDRDFRRRCGQASLNQSEQLSWDAAGAAVTTVWRILQRE